MKIRRTQRKAVAPVLATLMMIAVAVAMSVIIFVWSQGFLSQTSSAAGGQQSQQNIAAQSSVSIDSATFSTGSAGSTTIIVRNVGSVAETLGSLLIQGVPSNSGFTGSAICTTWTTTVVPTPGTSSNCASATGVYMQVSTGTVTSGSATVGKSNADVLTVTFGSSANNYVQSGDIINIKIATTAGTFSTQQFTVP